MKRAILLLVFTVAACSGGSSATPSPSPSAATHTIRGALVLHNGVVPDRGATTCAGTGGYSDIQNGTQVVVKDGSGTILATGRLVYEPAKTMVDHDCAFSFTVADVPDATFYSVEASHRGELTYSNADMVASDWHLDLTLGS